MEGSQVADSGLKEESISLVQDKLVKNSSKNNNANESDKPTACNDGAEEEKATACEGPNKVPQRDIKPDSTFLKPKITFKSPGSAVHRRPAVNKIKKSAPDKEASKEPNEIKNDPQTSNSNSQSGNSVISSAGAPKKQKVPYTAPEWSTICPDDYHFEVLKGGVMKYNLDLTKKNVHVFGRLEDCDVVMEHPTISRFHAVVVYRGKNENDSSVSDKDEGFYIMDLGSTHGTFVNKTTLDPKVYFRLRVGYVVKFGGSTRLHILQGPESDQDEEVDRSVVRKLKQKIEAIKEEQMDDNENNVENEDQGISWGMGEDAVEEEMDLEKLLASSKLLELKDPKKTLRGFFEREGLDLEYDTDERGTGNSQVYVARVKLPIEDASGEELVAEGSASKKKEAVLNCAYEACRIIDAYGMLRNATHESERSKKARKLAENEFYDSDDDSFLDRTGLVEKKRHKRLKRAGKVEDDQVETYDSLLALLEIALKEISTLQKTLKKDDEAEVDENQEGVDELDQYMSKVSSKLDKKSRVAIKIRLTVLHKERRRLEKLIKIVKPTSLPALKPATKTLTMNKTVLESRKGFEDISENPSQTAMTSSNTETIPAVDTNMNTGNHTKHTRDQTSVTKPAYVTAKKSVHISSTADALARLVQAENEPENISVTSEEKHPSKKVKRKKVYGAQMAPSSTDSKFANWVPPEGQSGDGKTRLNEKFGY